MLDYPIRETRAYVDLDAFEHNLNLAAGQVPGSSIMPAVKADAYGHGAIAIASLCERWGATMLAVANLEEYLVLRDNGITLPILILEDLFPHEVETALTVGARLSAGSVEYARLLSDTAGRLGTTAMIHLNVDTGMGRMGLVSDTPVAELLCVASLANTTLEGVFSHFPSSDERDKEFSFAQVEALGRIIGEAERQGVRPRYRHVANSGALIDFPDRVGWDLVRPGVMLYGMYPSEDVGREIGLRPVMRVVSRLVKITRHARAGAIGYGRTYTVRPGSLVGIVPIGYGDGYSRLFSNRGEVLVRGVRVPVAGRVSMDMIAVDLTRLGEDVTTGDEVVLLGDQSRGGESAAEDRIERISAEDLARLAGTITYEITCNFTPRIPRLYTQGGRVVAIQSLREGYRELSS